MIDYCRFCTQPTKYTRLLDQKRLEYYHCSPCDTTYVYNKNYGYRGYYMITDNYIIYHFPFSSNQFRLTDKEGKILLQLNNFPDIIPKNINKRINQLLSLKAFA